MVAKQRLSWLQNAQYFAPDKIFEVTRRFIADGFPGKVNLGQGTYRDEIGNPWILPSVRTAKELIADSGHEYLPIAGLKEFRELSIKLVLKDTEVWKECRVSTCQSISGTGALFLTGLALKKANSGIKTVYISEPTWSNHALLFSNLGYSVKYLPYYKGKIFDFKGYLHALEAITEPSAVIFHSCAHNPTGCDPSPAQWRAIASVVKEKSIFPIFDSAYLGFNSGSVDDDAWAIRYFVGELGLEVAICMSFAKSMGLYGERVGLAAFVSCDSETSRSMQSILENCQRATVSNPPAYGARIVAAVLGTPELAHQWAQDLLTMSGRIKSMREKLYALLLELETPGDWSHVIRQTGMFGYMEISPSQVKYLEDEYHIYMADTSRISVAGLNDGNVAYFAKSLDDTVRRIK